MRQFGEERVRVLRGAQHWHRGWATHDGRELLFILQPRVDLIARFPGLIEQMPIQVVMGWQDSHLHEFTLSGQRYGESNPEDEENVIDERTVRLRDLPLSIGCSMGYEYDFGDDWRHQVVLEMLVPADSGAIYPACIAGERSAPPEDVGGAGGYAEFLEAIADPKPVFSGVDYDNPIRGWRSGTH